MGGHRREYAILDDLLAEGEEVGMEIREHRLGGGRILAPAHAFATDRRIIIVRCDIFGMSHSVKMIRYEHITEVKMERGMGYCRLHFSLIGEQQESQENIKWITGIYYKDAIMLIQFINGVHAKSYSKIKSSGSAPHIMPLMR